VLLTAVGSPDDAKDKGTYMALWISSCHVGIILWLYLAVSCWY